jgi:alanyl-tRNA synthetase
MSVPTGEIHVVSILETLTAEEECFGRTIAGGLALLDGAPCTIQPGGELPGATAFTLYDSRGSPRGKDNRTRRES